jgi:hypothetical protein
MSSGTTAVVIVAIVVILVALGVVMMTERRRRLQRRFGPEYDRAVEEQNSKIRAEAELTERQRRVRKLDIKPLSESERQRYLADWARIQEQFVDAPATAVADAYALVTTVMQARGYPTEDDKQVAADLSVEHGQTVGHLRAAREITQRAAAGDVDTEQLRQALIHYRALFGDLLGEPNVDPVHPAAANGTVPVDTVPAETVPAETVPADTAAADDAVPADTASAGPVPAETATTDGVPADSVPADMPADSDANGNGVVVGTQVQEDNAQR